MKRTAIALGIAGLAVAWVTVREGMWRLDNPVLEASVNSPSREFVAEAYALNEGGGSVSYQRGPAPYGVGVYVRPLYMPLKSFGSTLVFASYCGPVRLEWRGAEELLIECKAEEAPNLLLTSHRGVKITYAAQKSS